MHQLGLRALILNYRMALVFIFLCAINQENAMTLERTLDVHKNLARWKGPDYDKLDKAKNIFFFTENTPEEEST